MELLISLPAALSSGRVGRLTRSWVEAEAAGASGASTGAASSSVVIPRSVNVDWGLLGAGSEPQT